MKEVHTYNCKCADYALILGSGYTFNPEGLEETGFVPYLDFLSPRADSIFSKQDGGHYYRLKNGKSLLVFDRRLHRYQGFSALDTVLPVKIAFDSGVKVLVLANASGGLSPDLKVGDFTVIRDHIVLPSQPDLSPDFSSGDIQSVKSPYDQKLNQLLSESVNSVTGSCREAVYAYMMGPAFETWAEVDFLQSIGADIVGMCTAYEAIYAKLCGVRVVGLSLVTNLHHREFYEGTSHEEVLKEAMRAQSRFQEILEDFLSKID
jgi:purine-nucleoside phosphorylase